MATRFDLIALAALLLTGCERAQPEQAAAPPRSKAAPETALPSPAATVTPAAAAAFDPNALTRAATAREAALLAGKPMRVRREGDTLFVRTAKDDMPFRTENCGADDDRCVSYHLDRIWGDEAFFGILIGYWEGGDYEVVNREGFSTTTGDRPLLSPGGRWFASAVHNDAYETSREGVHIYDSGQMQVVRTVPTTVLAYPEGLRWHGDGCLSFTAVDPGGPLQGPGTDRKLWYLVEAAPEWRLTDRRAPACR
jgi:hypothetical protein